MTLESFVLDTARSVRPDLTSKRSICIWLGSELRPPVSSEAVDHWLSHRRRCPAAALVGLGRALGWDESQLGVATGLAASEPEAPEAAAS